MATAHDRIGSLGGAYTAALGIMTQAKWSGRTYNASGYARAFLWESGAMTDLNMAPTVWLGIHGPTVVRSVVQDRRGPILWE